MIAPLPFLKHSFRCRLQSAAFWHSAHWDGADIQPRYPECARVTIEAADGGVYTGFLGAPVGMPENPTSDEALSDKFRHCVNFAGWSKEKCETVLEDLWDIEHAPNLSRLLRGEIK